MKLGEYGKAFCFLYAELRGTIAYAYEKKWWDYTIAAELFLEIYAAFEDSELPAVKTVEDILRSYVNDYCQDLMEQRIAEAVDPQLDFAVRIIMDSDLSDLKYLYAYGEYVSANERGVAEFLNSLSQEQIDSMAEILYRRISHRLYQRKKRHYQEKNRSTSAIISDLREW